MAFIRFLKKYICEAVFVINLILIPFNHDFKIWWQRPIVNDAMGYYAYLPAVFLYQDLTYNSIQEPWSKHNIDVPGNNAKIPFIVKYKGKEVNKYPPGVTYFQAPFFFLAHATALIFHMEADGYSDIYIYFMCIAAIFWQYVFLKLLWKIFRHYGLSDTAFSITAPLLSFGTNLYFYTHIFGSYSHVYSLLSISLFFYAGLKFFENFPNEKSPKYFFWMLIGLALAIIVRNLNVIAIFLLPCMGFRIKDFPKHFSMLKTPRGLLGIIVSSAMVFSMLLLWKLQTGYWVIDSYPGEHFNWGKPQIFKSLFSAHKGWFFYTPIALVALFGLFYTPRKLAINLALVMCLVIYITSSWGCWDYGTGFSMRAYIDWYLIISISLGFLIEHALQKKVFISFLLFVFIILTACNILWTVQFMRGIISGTSQGIEYSIKNFFRLRPIMQYQVSKNVTQASKKIVNDFNEDKQQPYAICDEANSFSKGLMINLSDYMKTEKYNQVRYGANIKPEGLDNPLFLCVSVTDSKDSVIFWKQNEINTFLEINKTEKVESGFTPVDVLPEQLPPGSKMNVFFWQPKGNTKCIIDDMYIELLKAGIE